MKYQKAFVIELIAASLLLMVALILVNKLTSLQLTQALFPVIGGFGVFTYMLHQSILKANAKSPARFVTAFMASVTVKMLVAAAFIGIYMYFNKESGVQVALCTFVIYIVNTWVLVKYLMREVRSPKN